MTQTQAARHKAWLLLFQKKRRDKNMDIQEASIPDGYGAILRYMWSVDWRSADKVIELLECTKKFPETVLLLSVFETVGAKPPIFRMELTGMDPEEKEKRLTFATLDFIPQDFME